LPDQTYRFNTNVLHVAMNSKGKKKQAFSPLLKIDFDLPVFIGREVLQRFSRFIHMI
jgi:hypothetical protein